MIPLAKDKKLAAGEDIDSKCLKCKDVTNHTIIAMAEKEVAKVQCNVCGARHKYRPPKPAKKTPAKKGPAAKKKAAANRAATRAAKEKKAAAAHFDGLLKDRNTATAQPYAMTAAFRENDLIDHPSFGLGLIIQEIRPNKIEVTFKEGNKILICALQN